MTFYRKSFAIATLVILLLMPLADFTRKSSPARLKITFIFVQITRTKPPCMCCKILQMRPSTHGPGCPKSSQARAWWKKCGTNLSKATGTSYFLPHSRLLSNYDSVLCICLWLDTNWIKLAWARLSRLRKHLPRMRWTMDQCTIYSQIDRHVKTV